MLISYPISNFSLPSIHPTAVVTTYPADQQINKSTNQHTEYVALLVSELAPSQSVTTSKFCRHISELTLNPAVYITYINKCI